MSVQSFPQPFRPDVQELVGILFRKAVPRRLHFIELFLDTEVKDVLGARFGLEDGLDRSDRLFTVKRDARLHERLGYDVFRAGVIRKDFFPMQALAARDTTSIKDQVRGDREWQEEHAGPIQSWKDFETYPWPKVSAVDFSALEWLEKNLPDGMGAFDLTGHIFEMLSFLLGYETLCYKVVDEPDLVDAVCARVGAFYVDYTNALADFSRVPLLWGSDDLGFRTGTMISPVFLREKILPWHAKCAAIAHAHGKPYLLHSCGKLDEIMEDLIGTVKVDAKHSFEDTIMPVTEAKLRYGHRVALLGGIDVDFLIRSPEAAVRRRVRETLDVCMKGGGYCLGTGNTVTNYMPVDRFLWMLEEGAAWRA